MTKKIDSKMKWEGDEDRELIFADLEWEREMDQRRRQSMLRSKKPINLSATIEDYFRSNGY